MCGIAGIMRFTPGEAPPPLLPVEWIRVLDDSVKHRGPDGRGVLVDRVYRTVDTGSKSVSGWIDVALIHRRLAIIDIEGGAQPMVEPPVAGGLRGEAELTPLADNALAVVFNGCIYNHRELRAELIAGGAKFQTDHSDTEVLLHGYRAWGNELITRLEGMFALAIWDRARGELLTSHDACTEKPVHVESERTGQTHVVVFSSTMASMPRMAMLRGEKIEVRRVDIISRADLLVTPWSTHEAAYDPPSCFIQERQSHRQNPLDRRRGRKALDPKMLDNLVHSAVADRLEADVPLGCFLSGGVDSSLIAAHALALRPDVRTFCVRMPDARYDESPRAAAVAKELGADHTTLECRPNPLEDLERLVGHIGVPFTDSSLLPTYWLCKAVRPHAKVALSGEGGDELFGGYERYIPALWPQEVKQALAELPAAWLERGHPKSRRSKLARLLRACQGWGYADLLELFPSEMGIELWPPSAEELREWREDRYWPEDPLAFDFYMTLPDDMLRKVDTASMAAGVEVRAPLLAPAVVDSAFDTPLDVLMPPTPFGGRRLKGLLKDALRLHLPDRLVDRPKSGFAIPIGEWFRSDYGGLGTAIRDVLASTDPWPSVTAACPLNLAFCRRILEEHMTGRRDHGQRLYALLVLHIWDRWLRSVRRD